MTVVCPAVESYYASSWALDKELAASIAAVRVTTIASKTMRLKVPSFNKLHH
jgi:hypothetical protein